MPGRFLEIPVFLRDCFIMPHPVDRLSRLSSKEFKPATDKIVRTTNEIKNYV